MRRHLRQLPVSVTLGAVLLAVALVGVLFLVLRRDPGIRAKDETASDRVFRSALLPDDGWTTYGDDVWSMGYPIDWIVAPVDGGVEILDEDGARYLTVLEETRQLGAIDTEFAADPSITKSAFLFASYPTVKYELPNGHEEYYISYNDRVSVMMTDEGDEEEVGIMLATFQFLY